MTVMSKFIKNILISAGIFVFSVAAYAYPLLQKGYPADADYPNLIASRNFAATGTYAVEGKDGIFLSSKKITESGVMTGVTNPLTVIIYGHLFKIFGFSPNIPVAVSVTFFALFNAVLFWLGMYLSSRRVGLIMAGISACIPIMVVSSGFGGFYEFGLFFFGLALLMYFGGRNGVWRAGSARIVLSGVLFALSALARNAFAVSFIPFLAYDFYLHRSFRRSILFAAPFIIIFGITLTPYSFLNTPNGYITKGHEPFGQLGHLFNDPYSFYHNREQYLKNLDLEGGLDRIGVAFAKRLGYPVRFSDNLSGYSDALSFYPKESLALITLGGPIMLALALYGFYLLRQRDKHLFRLIIGWIIFWYLYLSYSQFANWDHFIEIILPITLCMALGIMSIHETLKQKLSQFPARIIGLVIFLAVLGHLTQATKWRFHDVYRSSVADEVLILAEELKNQNLEQNDVIAVGVHLVAAYSLEYTIDQNVIYFNSETVADLVSKNILAEAFRKYKVTKVAGYDADLSRRIQAQTGLPTVTLPDGD